MTKYLLGPNGLVFDYSERMAKHHGVVVIEEKEAFPEKFAPFDIKDYTPQVVIEVPAEVVAPPVVNPELGKQKGKTFSETNFPKLRKTKADTAGLKGEF